MPGNLDQTAENLVSKEMGLNLATPRQSNPGQVILPFQ